MARGAAWEPPGGVTLRAVAIVVAIIGLAMLSQFYRSSIAVIAPNMMDDLRLSTDQLGLVSGSFFLIFGALQIPIGICLDRYGARRVVSLLLVLAVLGSLQFAEAGNLSALVVGRLMIGLGFSGLMIGALIVLRRWFPADRFTTVMAILFASSNAGSLCATWPLAASAAAWGWRGTFVGLSMLTALIAGGFFAIVRDAPPGYEARTAGRPSLLETIAGLKRLRSVPDLIFLLPIVAVGYGSVMAILGLWGGPYLYDVYGLDAEGRGLILTVMAVSMILGTVAFGPLDRRFGTPKKIVTAGGLATAACLFALALWPAPSLPTAGILLSLFCFVGAYSVVTMAHGMALFRDDLAGRGAATLNTALMGGAALIQFLSAAMIDGLGPASNHHADLSYHAVFAFIGILTIAALLIYQYAHDIGPAPDQRSNPAARNAMPVQARKDIGGPCPTPEMTGAPDGVVPRRSPDLGS